MDNPSISIRLFKVVHPRYGVVVHDGWASGDITAKNDKEEDRKRERDKRREKWRNKSLSQNL